MTVDWAARLGRKHGAREEASAQAAHAVRASAAQAEAAARARWTPMVGAVKRLVASYNAGAGRELLTVVEDLTVPDRPSVAIASSGGNAASLVASLEDTLICVSVRSAQGASRASMHHMHPHHSDEQAAAYLLQDWMERL